MAHTFALPVEEALALLEEEIAVLTEVITMTRSSVTAASEFVDCMEEAPRLLKIDLLPLVASAFRIHLQFLLRRLFWALRL
jgi:hypothetical protein